MIIPPGNQLNVPPEGLGKQLHSLFMQAPGLISVLRTKHGICELINPAFTSLLGDRDILNMPMRHAWPELEGQGLFEIVEQVLEQGQAYHNYKTPIRFSCFRNGQQSHVWIDIVYSPFRNEQGIVDGVMITGIDVTSEVRARQQLAEQQLLLEDLTDAAPSGLWMIDIKGDVTFVNHSWVEWTGKPAAEHMGRGWLNSVVAEDREMVIERFREGFNAREQFEVDFRIVRADGKVQWVFVNGKPRYLTNGAYAGYVGSCMDITGRKESQKKLQESEERFRNIADSAPVFIWMCNADHKSTFFNKSWLSFTGRTFEESVGKSELEDVHPDEKQRVSEFAGYSFKARRDFYIEFRLKRYDDVYRWIGMKFVPRYTAGVFEGFIGSGMDITDSKEHEQVKNDFIGMASHELKTPITSIKAYVQLLLNMKANDKDEFLKKSLNTINKQINKLTRLITDLLDIAKIENGRLSLNCEIFVLNDLLKEIIDEVQHTTIQHKIILAEHCHCEVYADKDRITQVIINFLTNAIKYAPDTTRIDVSIQEVNGDTQITVQDYGIGIGYEEQQKVFHRFYRVEGRNEQTFSGFGIGLYVAAEIVRRHKGRIWVESEKGKGSSFCFTLPPIESSTTV